jgi:hypothetical protein
MNLEPSLENANRKQFFRNNEHINSKKCPKLDD